MTNVIDLDGRYVTAGPADPKSLQQLKDCLAIAGPEARGVLNADHHVGYGCPVGGVLATKSVIIPAVVGVDQGCGNLAVCTGLKAEMFDIPAVMDEIFNTISFGMARTRLGKLNPDDYSVFAAIEQSPVREQRKMIQQAIAQFGTVGGGNHYVDLFVDENGLLWIGVHFGSRGFGHRTAKGFDALAAGLTFDDKSEEKLYALDITSPLGSDYITCAQIAFQYAYQAREWVVKTVMGIIGLVPSFEGLEVVHNHHNAFWYEEHDGEQWLVARKGATPAFPGQRGFVGASMGEPAVILEGVDNYDNHQLLRSTVHGAGRAMSRNEAAGKKKYESRLVCGNWHHCDFSDVAKNFQTLPGGKLHTCPKCGNTLRRRQVITRKTTGRIDWSAACADLTQKGIELRGGSAEEAPGAYKRLTDVLYYQGNSVRVLHTLTPLGVAMAGDNVQDPYKD